ncbi:MAG: hypothetical protein M0Z45_06865 [Actinomycetota bacterium]|nr:hypothetical protein [Actinomycetota bacterium]
MSYYPLNMFKVIDIDRVITSESLYLGPPSLAIFFRTQSGLNSYHLKRYLGDLESKKVQLIYLIDIERNWTLAQAFNVCFSPTTIRFDSRRELKKVVGLPLPKVLAGRLGL